MDAECHSAKFTHCQMFQRKAIQKSVFGYSRLFHTTQYVPSGAIFNRTNQFSWKQITQLMQLNLLTVLCRSIPTSLDVLIVRHMSDPISATVSLTGWPGPFTTDELYWPVDVTVLSTIIMTTVQKNPSEWHSVTNTYKRCNVFDNSFLPKDYLTHYC